VLVGLLQPEEVVGIISILLFTLVFPLLPFLGVVF
jgi:hypothetical protein